MKKRQETLGAAMKRKRLSILIIVIVLLLIIPPIYFRDLLSERLLVSYLSNRLDAKVTTDSFHLGLGPRIDIEGLNIVNNKGLNCVVGEATLRIEASSLLAMRIHLTFDMKDLKFSYPDSKIINGIADTLSIKPLDVFSFDSVKGKLYISREDITINALYAQGRLLKVSADGSIRGKEIGYSFKLILSNELTSSIPDSVRKVFFKTSGQFSELDLYVSGSTDNPSISMNTDLFKLTVR